MSSAATPDRIEACPLCGRPAASATRPFCGQGCRDRDLLNWLGDAYRVPGAAAGPEDVGAAD
jgi:endogenous inhibitor of DNA gyrase (YacG/DUF329 family)